MMGEWNTYKTLFTSGALDRANITGALGVREQPRVGLKGTLPTSYLDWTRPAPQTHRVQLAKSSPVSTASLARVGVCGGDGRARCNISSRQCLKISVRFLPLQTLDTVKM